MTFLTLWQAIASGAALAIVVQCICGLNRMDWRTDHRIRIAYLGFLLAGSACAMAPLYNEIPATWHEALLTLVLAVFLRVNRRRTYLVSAAAA